MKDFAEKFYNSRAWIKTRKSYAASVGNLCEECAKRNIFVPGEIVHHIKHITPDNINDPEITLNWENLKLLCRSCHEQIHRRGSYNAKRYSVDELGRVKSISDQTTG